MFATFINIVDKILYTYPTDKVVYTKYMRNINSSITRKLNKNRQ